MATYSQHRPLQLLLLLLCLLPIGVAYGQQKQFTLVIDAGHGGHDSGALGRTAKEKDVNLAVALKFGKLVERNFRDVKVIYTRKTDVFVELNRRATIANEANANLFISIHANSLDKSNRSRNTIRGASTYTLGLGQSQSNLEVAKRENSVILLEEDFSTRYEGFDPNSTESYIIFEFLQNRHLEQSISFASMVQSQFVRTAKRVDRGVRQASLWVLRATSMPAVLVELDFICNPTEERFMSSSAGQEKFAKALCDAFEEYKREYDRKQLSEQGEEKASSATQSSDICYKIQILTSPKKLSPKDSKLKGLSGVNYYYEGGLYKYTYLESSSISTLQRELKQVKKRFKDAFIITMRDGKRIK